MATIVNNGEVDRLSDLPDEVLVLVLDHLRSDVRLLARTTVLSKRWRTLPLMLPRLNILTESFIRRAANSTTTVRWLHEATAQFTDALRFFLATGPQRNVVETLKLRFPLTKQRSLLHEIGRLVSGADVRRLEVTLDTAVDTRTLRVLRDADGVNLARCYARRFTRLLRAAPARVLGSLGRLTLQNLCFPGPAHLAAVLRDCDALETLHLHYCWFAAWSALSIDAPRLRELRVVDCYVDGVHLVRAPDLVHLWCENWYCQASPVTFAPNSAPSLKRVTLINREEPGQLSFKLSDLLGNANPLEHLSLDFVTRNVWVQPESLRAAFTRLKRLHLKRISPQIDMSWTVFFLEAAPLLELVDIHVSHDPIFCTDNASGASVEDLQWDVSDGFQHRRLQAFKIRGGIDADGDLSFVRLVRDRAVNLKLLLLDAKVTCGSCWAAKQQDPSVAVATFPGDRDGVDAFVKELKDGLVTTPARIVIVSSSAQIFEYIG